MDIVVRHEPFSLGLKIRAMHSIRLKLEGGGVRVVHRAARQKGGAVSDRSHSGRSLHIVPLGDASESHKFWPTGASAKTFDILRRIRRKRSVRLDDEASNIN